MDVCCLATGSMKTSTQNHSSICLKPMSCQQSREKRPLFSTGWGTGVGYIRTINEVLDFLKGKFNGRVISNRLHFCWPIKSADLNLLDFFLLGCSRSRSKKKPKTICDLKKMCIGLYMPIKLRETHFIEWRTILWSENLLLRRWRASRAPSKQILTLLKYIIKRANLGFQYLFTEVRYL